MLRRFFEYFKYHRSERLGAIILLFVILIVLVGTEVYTSYIIKNNSISPEDLVSLEILIADSLSENAKEPSDPIKTLFQFNPNSLSDSGFFSLGFSEKEIKTLRNYQKAGAKFEIKSDFSKLFFVDSSEYKALEPYIDLPERKTKTKKTEKKSIPINQVNTDKVLWSDTANTDAFEYKTFRCDLNHADTTELKRLPGIGSFYAKKIVEYREELGGYHSIAQLLELWKMTPDKIDRFANQLVIDKGALNLLSINEATAQELSVHPYISFKLANQIVNFREENGVFENAKTFCEAGFLENDCSKILPYLEF